MQATRCVRRASSRALLNQRLASAVVLIAASAAHAQWSAANLAPDFHIIEQSAALGGAGTQVVGWGLVVGQTTVQYHAMLWLMNAPYRVDLNPAGATRSEAFGTTGTQQVGNAVFSNANHGGLWNGTAASWVDLNPAGASSSRVTGFAGTQQVGSATFGNATRAGRWNGTAASWIDLNPAGATSSQINAVSGTHQVGRATFGNAPHAGFWNGTAASWVDLHPAGATESVAYGISGTTQVGYARFGGTYRAGVWGGTAASWQPLPYPADETTWTEWHPAQGTSVWTDGARLYVAGYISRAGYVASLHRDTAVLWSRPLLPPCGNQDFNGDGDSGTDQDIEAFFACLAGNCCPTCGTADFNADGDSGTDLDIEAFFRVLGGGPC